jgi:hypothetical protein
MQKRFYLEVYTTNSDFLIGFVQNTSFRVIVNMGSMFIQPTISQNQVKAIT